MNKQRPIQPRQLIAAFLTVIFLFVHVYKLFHHHDASYNSLDYSKFEKSAIKAQSCIICDYHFAKDAQDAPPVIALVQQLPALLLFSEFPVQRTTSIGLSSSDRGPPALG